ncbi:MAG: hypothetical protein ACRCVN_00540 [Spirochaetia bacterium]
MNKKYYGYLGVVFISILLLACASSPKKIEEKTERTLFNQKYFFRPGADYYSFVDLKTIRPLMREIVKQMPSGQRMQMQMIVGRTERVFSYHLNNSTYSLIFGSFPKALLDGLLGMHPEWLSLEPEIAGYRHYEMNLEIGLPLSNILYMTTSSLSEAYRAPTLARESVLPAFVIQGIDENAFVLYFPRGDRAFAKDNSAFSDLPPHRLLMSMTPIEARTYRIEIEFVFDTPSVAAGFIPRLKSMLEWYKSYYTGFGDLLDVFSMNQEGKNIKLSAILEAEQVVRISSEAMKTSMNRMTNKKTRK